MDVSDYYQTFFAEADELLADMEKYLLELDLNSPDKEMLNAIFRAAHSIKGGAGTFGFSILQETTHLLENLLDDARCGNLSLNNDIINLFLESKDIMQEQLDSYKASQEPEQASFQYICEVLRQIAQENKQVAMSAPASSSEFQNEAMSLSPSGKLLNIELSGVKDEAEKKLLIDELSNFGALIDWQQKNNLLLVQLRTSDSAEDILSVLCFLLEPEQIVITEPEPVDAGSILARDVDSAPASASHILSQEEVKPATEIVPLKAPPAVTRPKTAPKAQSTESGSIRVAVEKVDQIINQVGELIITQAMLSQLSGSLDPSVHDILINSIGQMERNARDLQESVMSIRMMPMEYVFSRFPRLVHDLAAKLNKDVELTLIGGRQNLIRA